MTYRSEIDGLRAFAVLAVIFYHAKFLFNGHEIFSGGFVGVDIFFVISGYLITLKILTSLKDKSFCLRDFYERRARRILPAFLAMATLTLPYAVLKIMPTGLKNYAESLISSLVFGSNFYFWKEDGYAAEASTIKPLLHTWSLAVEEQFYILFPLIMLLLWKYARAFLLPLFLLGGAVSFAYGVSLSQTDNIASFFLLPTRAWELLAGALLAALEFKYGRNQNMTLSKTMPAFGVVLMTYPIFAFTDQIHFPYIQSVMVIVGSMLFIRFAGMRDIITRLFSSKISMGIGLLSYSLYLWHQPLFAFAHIAHGAAPSTGVMCALIVATFFIAYGSWCFVEIPFRDKNAVPTPHFLKRISSIFILMFCMGAYTVYTAQQNRIPFLVGAAQDKIEPWHLVSNDKGETCWGRSCTLLQENDKNDHLILVGDSHLAAMSHVFFDFAQKNKMQYSSFTYPGCHINFGLEHAEDGKQTYCSADFMNKIHRYIGAFPNATIILHNGLTDYLMGQQFGGQDWGYLRPQGADTDDNNRIATVKAGITHAIDKLVTHEYKVVLIYPTPSFRKSPLDTIQYYCRNQAEGCPDMTSLPRDAYTVDKRDIKIWLGYAYDIYDAVKDAPNLIRIRPEDYFCDTDTCSAIQNNTMMYWDHHHMNRHGGEYLGQKVLDALQAK